MIGPENPTTSESLCTLHDSCEHDVALPFDPRHLDVFRFSFVAPRFLRHGRGPSFCASPRFPDVELGHGVVGDVCVEVPAPVDGPAEAQGLRCTCLCEMSWCELRCRVVSGVEWSGVEWSGVEWSGVEWSGVEWSEEDGMQSKSKNSTQDVGSTRKNISLVESWGGWFSENLCTTLWTLRTGVSKESLNPTSSEGCSSQAS